MNPFKGLEEFRELLQAICQPQRPGDRPSPDPPPEPLLLVREPTYEGIVKSGSGIMAVLRRYCSSVGGSGRWERSVGRALGAA
jgi:hypothetical protein